MTLQEQFEQILDDYKEFSYEPRLYNADNTVNALIQAVEASLPGKIANWNDVDMKRLGERTHSSGNAILWKNGYNAAIKDIKKNIRI